MLDNTYKCDIALLTSLSRRSLPDNMKFTVAGSALLFAASVSAHTILDEIYVGGVSQGLHNCLRLPSYDGPITGNSL